MSFAKNFEFKNISGAGRISVWDPKYDRGVGATVGGEAQIFMLPLVSLQIGYSHFGNSRTPEMVAVEEMEAVLGYRYAFPLGEDQFIYPRLGGHVGTSRNVAEKWHALVGVDAEGVIPIGTKWSILMAFQPSYSIGDMDGKENMYWRVALGFLYDIRPTPLPKLRSEFGD